MKLHLPLIAATALSLMAFVSSSQGQNTASSPATEPAKMTFAKPPPMESLRDVGNQAIKKLLANFAESKHAPGAKGFILLPLATDIDSSYFSHQFEVALTQRFAEKGLKVYTRDDKTLTQIFDFTAWAQTFPEAIDEATVQKLGGIVDAPAIISPRLDISVDERGTITARANMRVIVRRTAEIPPGVSEGYEQLKAIPTNDELLRWALYGLAGLVVLYLIKRAAGAILGAAKPR